MRLGADDDSPGRPKREARTTCSKAAVMPKSGGGVHQLIDRWLHERQQLVQAFDALSGIQAPAPNAEELQHFCQLLLDYVSAGHFEVYEQLTAEGKAFGDQRGLELAKQIFPGWKPSPNPR